MMMIILSLLLGVLDVGRAYFTFLAMQDAAGEGAMFGSLHPTWKTSADKTDPNNITYRVKTSAPTGTLVNWSSATVNIDTSGGTSIGNQITVTVTSNFQLVTPFIGTIVGSQTLPLKAKAVALITSAGP